MGLQVAIDEQPDVIVSDVMMPVMDGFELAHQLKSSPETDFIPLILLTAKSTKRDTVHGLQQGADDYLSKPFDKPELMARIASQIALKQKIARRIIMQVKDNNNVFGFIDKNIRAIESEDKFPKELKLMLLQKLNDTELDVEQIAKNMNVTRSTLYREVKKYYSCTPKQLLKIIRLECSLEMLRNNKGTISEVAYAVGFHSLSNFSRAFSEHYKLPPTRFDEITA